MSVHLMIQMRTRSSPVVSLPLILAAGVLLLASGLQAEDNRNVTIAAEVNTVRMTADVARDTIGSLSTGHGETLLPAGTLKKIWKLVDEKKATHVRTMQATGINGQSMKQCQTKEFGFVTGFMLDGNVVNAVTSFREIGGSFNVIANVKPDNRLSTTFAFTCTEVVEPMKTVETPIKGFEKPFHTEIPCFIKEEITSSLDMKDGDTLLLGIFNGPSEESKGIRDVVFMTVKTIGSPASR